MFDRIAPVYDAMNRLMTAGLDRRWREVTAAAVVRPGDRVLDACCGTGDLALAARAAGGEVLGLDFSEAMLVRARRKAPDLEWVRGDLLALPFPDASFDWIYVDGNHLYEYVRADLERYDPKVKPGGLIAGDDYGVRGWWDDGVTRAVDEFVEARGYEVVSLEANQFVLRKT